jgi:hypothetical protein
MSRLPHCSSPIQPALDSPTSVISQTIPRPFHPFLPSFYSRSFIIIDGLAVPFELGKSSSYVERNTFCQFSRNSRILYTYSDVYSMARVNPVCHVIIRTCPLCRDRNPPQPSRRRGRSRLPWARPQNEGSWDPR